MAIIRWFLEFFGKSENKLEENIKEWDRNFEKGKLRKVEDFVKYCRVISSTTHININ